MLIIPAKSRGIIETVPFLSSIRSMMNIAMMDVKATVICNHNQLVDQKVDTAKKKGWKRLLAVANNLHKTKFKSNSPGAYPRQGEHHLA